MKKPSPSLPGVHRHRMVWIGLALAAAFWVFESVMHRLVFGSERIDLAPGDWDEIWMRALIGALFVGFGAYTDRQIRRLAKAQRERAALQSQLEASLAKVLSGFVSICMTCKRIRTDEEEWVRIEQYVQERTDATFSHGLCEACYAKLHPKEAARL